ncbi:MAG: hypothetical protein WCF24_04070 [Acidimicrobiales bacterium]
MRIPHSRGARPGVLVVLSALVVAGSLVFSACSSAASTANHTSKSGNSNTTAKITANWTAFFKGSTPATKKVTLLQNGSEFASFLKSQSKTSTGASVSVKVTKVKVTSKTSATVTYTIYLGKTPELVGSSGKAVLQKGTWKVSDVSFCALLSLQGTASQVKACATS